jgi:hypothetical protein
MVKGITWWVCRCDCGRVFKTPAVEVVRGNNKSCGCLKRLNDLLRNVTHGMSESRTWQSWKMMKQRCLNPKAINYQRYGGRGIKIAERWLSFENFLADMGERPANKTLDRIDNDGDYGPGNCRWATLEQQISTKTRRGRYSSHVSPPDSRPDR